MVEKTHQQSGDGQEIDYIAEGEAILDKYGFGDRVDEIVTHNGVSVRAGSFLTLEHCRQVRGLEAYIERLPENDPNKALLADGVKTYIGKFFPSEIAQNES